MTLKDKLTEFDQCFLKEAEQAARNKLVNPHTNPLYKHGFIRFGPHPSNSSYELVPNNDEIRPTVDRLESIMRSGLLSYKAAKRQHIEYSRNWLDPNNQTHVSLFYPYESLGTAIYSVIAGYYKTDTADEWPKVPMEDMFVLLVDKKQRLSRKKGLCITEVLATHIGKQKFRGLVFVDEHSYYLPMSDLIRPSEQDPQDRAAKITTVMLRANLDQPASAVPLYGYKGDIHPLKIYWPTIA